MKFIHIADIHFRGLTRHKEYIKVFERFFEQAREIKPDYIFVGGDIVHSKTQGITPELIEVLTWWFKELANIADTHIVLGNHDGIILNPDRQDAVTPIISAINSDRLHLYKKSGTYPINDNFALNVFSCFDEAGWINVKPDVNKINIASFHGSVTSAVTDIGWELEGDVDISFFEPYDFVFLGDIHKQQFLRWREISPGVSKPDMGFSGSTIQQNHGEDSEKGFLLWDIRSKNDFDVNFHKVEGVNPFCSIDWLGNVEDTVSHGIKTVPKNARLRVKADENIPHVLWNRLSSILNKELCLDEITIQANTSRVETPSNEIGSIAFATDSISKYNTPTTQFELLRQFYNSENETFTDDDWKIAERILTDCLSNEVHLSDICYGSKWSLEKIEFDNTFSFGETNILDLTNLEGITGIFGKNTAGKSSIVGTLMYNLFNGSDRGSLRNLNIVNENKQYCLSKAWIRLGNERIRVERQTVKKKEKSGIDGALTNLNVFKVSENDDVILDLSGEQRRDSEQYLRTRLGTGDDFTITSVCTQGDTAAFVKFKNTARKNILTRLLGLDIFEKIGESLKVKSSELQSSLKKIVNRNWDEMIDERTAKIALNTSEIEQLSKKHNDCALQIQNLNLVYASLNYDPNLSLQLSDREEKLKKAKQVKQSVEVALNNLLAEKSDIGNLLEEAVNKPSIDIESLKQQHKESEAIARDFTEAKYILDKLQNTLKQKDKSAKTLKQVPCGDKFPTCKFIKDSYSDHLELPALQVQVADAAEKLVQIETKLSIAKSRNVEKLIESQEKEVKKITDFKLKIAEINEKINLLEKRHSSCMTLITDLENQIGHMQEKINANVQHRIDEIKDELSKLSNELNNVDKTRLELSADNGKLMTIIGSLKREKDNYTKLSLEWKIFDKLIHAYSKRGIPLLIIAAKLPQINAEIANILQGIVDFTVELETDIDSNEMDVYINYGETRRLIELASGMEKMISAIAIRIALINASCLPKSDMFIIDEGFGVLDDENLEACNRFLVSLKRWFRCVLIITHIDGIKDAVDNIIEVSRKNNEYTKLSIR